MQSREINVHNIVITGITVCITQTKETAWNDYFSKIFTENHPEEHPNLICGYPKKRAGVSRSESLEGPLTR